MPRRILSALCVTSPSKRSSENIDNRKICQINSLWQRKLTAFLRVEHSDPDHVGRIRDGQGLEGPWGEVVNQRCIAGEHVYNASAEARSRCSVREVFIDSPRYWNISGLGRLRSKTPVLGKWSSWMRYLQTFFGRPLGLSRSHTRRGGRAAECRRLESARGETLRGFKSLPRRTREGPGTGSDLRPGLSHFRDLRFLTDFREIRSGACSGSPS